MGPAPPHAAASRRAPVLLLGLMADKDAREIVGVLAALEPAHVVCTSAAQQDASSSPPHDLARLVHARTGRAAVALPELDAALGSALAAARERGTFLVAVGSLRLCGAVRSNRRIVAAGEDAGKASE